MVRMIAKNTKLFSEWKSLPFAQSIKSKKKLSYDLRFTLSRGAAMLPDQNKCSLTLRIDFSFLRLKTRYVLEQLFLYNPTLFPTLCIKFAQNNNNTITTKTNQFKKFKI